MDSRSVIQNSIDYIEEHLTDGLTARRLADDAGFSLFHYYRLFQSAVGMPVMRYILRRRILNALYDISRGEDMTDTAFSYGFDTFAGFYKACRRETGYTPSEFAKKYKTKRPERIDLFKEEHIMLSHKRITEILTHWGLENEPIRDIFYENTGTLNDSACYVGDGFVLRFTADRGGLSRHIELAAALERAGLLAPSAVKTKDGRELVEEDGLFFCLTKRLDGTGVRTAELLGEGGNARARFLGEITAKLHSALKTIDADVDDTGLYAVVKDWAMPETAKILDIPAELREEYTSVFGGLHDGLPRQIIHRDPNPSNIITDGEKWGFSDFDLSERNVRIFDPCYVSTGILSECFTGEEAPPEWPDIYRNIIRGYDSIAGLSAEEKRAVPYVVLSIQFICTAWLADKKYQDIFRTNIKMTKWIIDHFEEIKKL